MDPGPPVAPARPLRWGLPDVLIAWVVGLVAGLIASAPFIDTSNANDPTVSPGGIVTGVYAQNIAIVLALLVVARVKGRGSLGTDFGFRIDPNLWYWVLLGLLLAVAANLVLLPITELAELEDSAQEVVQQFEAASPVLKALFFPGVVILAPIAEELLFRGALLRSLLRRTTPATAVFVAALVFALVHVLGDPDTYFYVPAFLLLGLVSGWRAVVTGNLSQSIYLHAGFNLLASVLIVS
jgi:membrane protease YdiL (CAAX protease family)